MVEKSKASYQEKIEFASKENVKIGAKVCELLIE